MEGFDFFVALILLFFLRVVVSSRNIVNSPHFRAFGEYLRFIHGLFLFLNGLLTAVALAVDDIVRLSGFRVDLSLRLFDCPALQLLQVFFRVGFAVDDIELIINRVSIKFLAIVMPQTLGFVLLWDGNGGLAVDDVIIRVVLVIILLNIPTTTRCCICSFIF